MSSLKLNVLALISVIGIAYSGYLSYISFITGHPACESFYLGLPACFYGLVVYFSIFVVAATIFLTLRNKRTGALVAIPIAGTAFSGYLTWYVFSQTSCAVLQISGIPPCVYGD
jgi:uncharacterized membrane protein